MATSAGRTAARPARRPDHRAQWEDDENESSGDVDSNLSEELDSDSEPAASDSVWLHGLGAPEEQNEHEHEHEQQREQTTDATDWTNGDGSDTLHFHSHPVASPSAAATIDALQSLAALAATGGHNSKRRTHSPSDTDEKENEEEEDEHTGKKGTGDGDGDGSGDEDEIDEEDSAHLKPLSRSSELLVRAAMCGLSLVLLWVTSLSLAQYVASSVAGSPSFEPVVNQWVATFSVANSQADMHAQCGTSVLAACNRALNASIVQREAEWQASQEAARNQTLHVQARSSQCEQNSITTLQSINTWMAAGARMAYRDDACSAAEVDALRALLNDRRVNRLELQGLASSYVSTTDLVMQDTLAQLRLVEEYNAQFMANQSDAYRAGFARMQAQLGGMIDARALTSYVDAQIAIMNATSTRVADCLGRKGGANSMCPSGTLVDAYSAELAQLRASYNSLQSLGQSNLRALVLYSASVTRKLSDVQSFFNLLYPVANALSSLGINVLNIPSLDDVPNVVPNPAFIAALANSVDLPDMGAFYAARFAPIKASWSAECERARQLALASVGRALDNVTTAISNNFPPDPLQFYHPPQVQPEVQSLQLQLAASGEAFQRGSDASVEALISLPGAAEKGWSSLLNDTRSALPSNLTSLSFSLPPLSTLSLNMPIEGLTGSLSLSATLVAMLTAVGGAVLAGDYVYRNVASVRMVWQYVRAPQEMLPVIDARTQASKAQQAAAQANSSSFVDKAGYYLSHSGTLVLVGAVCAAWVVAIMVAAYVPIYQSYHEGCVSSHNGTFISRNAFSLAYNYASLKGNMRILVSLAEFEARRAMACGRYEQRFVTQQAEGGTSAAIALSTQRTAWSNMDLMARCIDHTASFNLSALPLNLTRPALPDPTIALAASALDMCAVDLGSSSGLNSGGSRAVFNCSWLPTCATGSACPGPSQLAIRASTFDASCSTEYTAHQSLLYFALVSLIFICLNVSRAACMKAIVRLGWRALTPAGLTFIATCDHRGRQMSTAAEEEEAERKRRRKKRLKAAESSDADSDLRSSDSSDSDSSVSASERSTSSAAASSLRKRKQTNKKAAASSNIPASLLHREMLAYESSAGRYLLLTLLAHVPYLLLLFALRDPFDWGSALRIAAPPPYHSDSR